MKQSFKSKLRDEEKRLNSTLKLYILYMIAAVVLVILTNFIVKVKGFPNTEWFAADEGAWIGFYGSLIGGFITLLGVNQTIQFTQAEHTRLQKIKDERLQRQEDLVTIQYLWELETSYHQLSKELYLTVAALEKVKGTPMLEIEEILMSFQTSMKKNDVISLSAKVDWDTYDRVTKRMRHLREIFLKAEKSLYESQKPEALLHWKEQLIRELREQKVQVDQSDALFEHKRVQLENQHIHKTDEERL